MTVTRGTSTAHERLARSPAARTAQDVLRGIAALTALLAALVGMPWALATLGGSPLPAHLPSLPEIGDALTTPDDGTLFLRVLLIVGWVGWALFAISVLVEIPAQLRGRSAPRLPALATSQRVAGALVTTIAVLFVTTPASPTATPTAAAAAVATETGHDAPKPEPQQSPEVVSSSVADQTPVGSATPAALARHPTYRVRRYDTLWAIAERCLGAGERFTDIAALNYGVEQSDGHALTNSHWIYPGWVLRLPTDARLDPGDSEAHQQSRGREQYTVQPGDTLSGIAQSELGSANRFRQIAELNTGRTQPDGRTLSDPNHIEPGWHLQLPPAASTKAAADHRTGRPADHAAARNETDLSRPAAPPPDRARDTNSSETNVSDHPATEKSAYDNPIPAKVGLGLAGITVAALLAGLARRRTMQQRARRPGRRITLPPEDARVVETQLRAADDRDTLEVLRAALLLLARRCAEADRLLPNLAAVRVNRTDIELLLLTDDTDPVAPFDATEKDRWHLAFADIDVESDELIDAGDGVPFPYPALLTIHAAEDTTTLIDLEAAGTLTVVGPPEQTRPIIDAWAVELAAAPSSETIGLTLVGCDWPATAVDAARVRRAGSVNTAARSAAARARAVDAILAQAQLTTVREARSRGVAPDIWDPEVVLCMAADSDEDHAEYDALRATSGQGVALVISLIDNESIPPGWTLSPTGNHRWRIEPLGLAVTPPRLAETPRAAITAALTASHDHDGTEAPTLPRASSTMDAAPRPLARGSRTLRTVPAERDAGSHLEPPQILVLGPIEIRSTNGEEAESDRRRKLTELAAYIALHPGADNRAIDDAIWPTRRISRSTRNSATSRLRRWLGEAPDGDPWLPPVPDRGRYRFRAEVGCDWQQFQELARRGLASGPDGLDDLQAALALVRARPFAGVPPAWYTWAEYDIQEMISAVTDVAHVLSSARLAAGDTKAARMAASKGLLVEPISELLTHDAVLAATAAGDREEVERLLQQLSARLAEVDPDADIGSIRVGH